MQNRLMSDAQIEKSLSDLPIFEKIRIKGTPTPEMEPSKKYINAHYKIPYYWDFSGNGVEVFFKRVIRKLVKCFLLPIVEKQNELNANFVRCINGINRLETESSKRLTQLEIQVFQLAQRNEELENALQSAMEENKRICHTARRLEDE